MPKRKAADAPADAPPPRRSTRQRPSLPNGGDAKGGAAIPATKAHAPKRAGGRARPKPKEQDDVKSAPAPRSKSTKAVGRAAKKPETKTAASASAATAAGSPERWFWLMKAEPESRFENGVDVRFSIDDLAARAEPEPWDGIRAYAARNNLRAMKKGELAFFYHSNCKEPGIVGTMEIVQEHSPDLSAHDPQAPYYDASSKPEDPKWSVVHVRFRSRFAQPIGLKELREMGKPGEPLEHMQMLKQSRLSVSRVSPAEWEYLMDVVKQRGGEAP
ncbi:DUF55-domain-containing protein [Xylariaceae sp. FL0804]|nr:DUF55-domain-containing protein [Xylariaceae sp. FL0804]